MLAVHLAKQVEFHSLDVTWYLMIADLGDPRLHSGTTRVAYGGPLERGREKFGTPAIGATVRQSRANGDESRHVVVLGSQSEGGPRTDSGTNERITTSVQLEQGAAVARIRNVHRVGHAQIVDALVYMEEPIAHPNAALYVLSEFQARPQKVERLPRTASACFGRVGAMACNRIYLLRGSPCIR